jgi:hypothetical protein
MQLAFFAAAGRFFAAAGRFLGGSSSELSLFSQSSSFPELQRSESADTCRKQATCSKGS